MRIALCSKGNFSLEKGFTKNRIELAEGLEKLGWSPTLVDKKMLGLPEQERYNAKKHSFALQEFLLDKYYDFDVVLYEYDTLPFSRKHFNPKTLFVARPAILAYHFPLVQFPYDLKTRFSLYLKKKRDQIFSNKRKQEYLKKVDYSLSQSDLIQVQNTRDRELLISKGFPEDKIIIIPNGIDSTRIINFGKYLDEKKEKLPLKLAFIGTFDFRKGAMDFGPVFRALKKQFPEIQLKLLGTRGLFATKQEVLKFFPKKYHSSIEVLPKFKADKLPELLSDCHAGIFPSYLESFGFGALEMMCAGLPVVAYDVPGPSDFILPELLVSRGDWKEMTTKLAGVFSDPVRLEDLSKKARQRVIQNYCWEDIAKRVDQKYRYYHAGLQNGVFSREKNSSRKFLYKV